MAEFAEVIKKYKRMCSSYEYCKDCPLNSGCCCGIGFNISDDRIDQFEQIVMTWAKEHPEPKYPTWEEWLEKTFGADGCSLYGFSPCVFNRMECNSNQNCSECRKLQIPKEVAEKLGIKPKNEKEVNQNAYIHISTGRA